MNKYANTYMSGLQDILGQALKEYERNPNLLATNTFEQGEGNPVSKGSPPSRRSFVGRLRGISGGHTVTSDVDEAQAAEGTISMSAGAPSRLSRELGVKANMVPLKWYPPNSNVKMSPAGKMYNDPVKGLKSMYEALISNSPKKFPISGSMTAKVIGTK